MAAGKPLTATFVRNIKTKGKYFDNSRMGLFLRIDKYNRKQRVMVAGKRREVGLGSYPVVTLAMAREQALVNKRTFYDGRDPIAESVRRNLTAVLNLSWKSTLRQSCLNSAMKLQEHRKQWRATLDTYAMPIIGNMLVTNITVGDIRRVLEPIWTEKTETANRLRGRIAELRKGDNPARWRGNLSEVLPAPSKIKSVRHFPALAQADTGRWWNDLAKRDGVSIKALQFATLAVSRSGEVRGMTWDELDLEAENWTIPDKRMKARRLHRVPLTGPMLEIIHNMPRLEGCPYVFFAANGGMLSDMALSSVMRKMHQADIRKGGNGYFDPSSDALAVPHGLRSTFRDWAAEGGYDHILAELALAHTVGSTVHRAYRRSDMLKKRKKMLDDWGRLLAG